MRVLRDGVTQGVTFAKKRGRSKASPILPARQRICPFRSLQDGLLSRFPVVGTTRDTYSALTDTLCRGIATSHDFLLISAVLCCSGSALIRFMTRFNPS